MTYDIYSAMGNRIRANLVLCLADKPKNVTDLIRTCGLAQSAVSQHLTKLKEAGLVKTKRSGTSIVYSLAHKKAAEISKLLIKLSKEVS